MQAETSEFSRPLGLGQVRDPGQDLDLRATPAECAALATRFGILAVDSLCASLHLTPETDGAVRVEGELRAKVIQACVVTLEPVRQRVLEKVGLRLLPKDREPADSPEDPLDEIESRDGMVDLGEAIAEQLALALDPYPKAPNAVLPPEAQDAASHPFAALMGLRPGQKPD